MRSFNREQIAFELWLDFEDIRKDWDRQKKKATVKQYMKSLCQRSLRAESPLLSPLCDSLPILDAISLRLTEISHKMGAVLSPGDIVAVQRLVGQVTDARTFIRESLRVAKQDKNWPKGFGRALEEKKLLFQQ